VIRIHYETQFRFIQFYKVMGPIPYWNNPGSAPMSKDQLTTAVGGAPDGWLAADDRFVHLDDEKIENKKRVLMPTEFKIEGNRGSLLMAMGESKQISNGTRRLIWVPRSGKLPNHVHTPDGTDHFKDLADVPDAPVPRQWGIRTAMDVVIDPCSASRQTFSYKTVLVWERWALDGKASYSLGMAALAGSTDTANPAIYAGFPRAMDGHTSDDDLEEYP